MIDYKKYWLSFGQIFGWTPEIQKVTEIETKEVIKEVEVVKEVPVSTNTPLDKYCKNAFKSVEKFAYKDKGIFKDIRYGMYPNELIQPELFLVQQLRKEIGSKPTNMLSWAGKVAQYVDNRLKWVSDDDTDSTLDAYQDVYATILSPKQDCENHASLVSSIEPEFGIAFGFCGKTGHAWNVFVINDELWCIETNSVRDYNRNAKVFKYADQDLYKIHWIFTQNGTYQCVPKPTNFGYKANL
jgi:hypothetical protein